MQRQKIRLGVNIDHVATLRNVRGGRYPEPLEAALIAQNAGADGITAHLREDRRHICDDDITRIVDVISVPLNLEMAATAEMQKIALLHRPHAVCLVPEKREERTTEGGLRVSADEEYFTKFIDALKEAGCRVSLFVAPVEREIRAAAKVGAHVIELHTGTYAEYFNAGDLQSCAHEQKQLENMAALGKSLNLEIHAGHGLSLDNVKPIARIKELSELNIGHFIVSRAVFVGLFVAIAEMRSVISAAFEADG